MIHLLLCGGSGARLWPLSRQLLPKQFVPFIDGQSLFQATVVRNRPLVDEMYLLAHKDHYFLAAEQLEADHLHSGQKAQDVQNNYILEPVARNTAPAIVIACLLLEAQNKQNEIVLVTPADHAISDVSAYHKAVKQAHALAQKDMLVTFGIQPSSAEAGYGYIKAKGTIVEAFVEKPDAAVAQQYIDEGNYYWNAGIFCFRVTAMLAALRTHAPTLLAICQQIVQRLDTKESIHRLDAEIMNTIEPISIDYAVMEHAQKVAMVVADVGWSDVGSFDGLSTFAHKSTKTNAIFSIGAEENNVQPVCVDAHNNFVVQGNRHVALVDVDNLCVVDTDDALLVSKRGSTQKVRDVVEQLQSQQLDITQVHTTAYRPWGSYHVLLDSPGYKIKRITVKSGSKLSLQKHFHRSEHWVVVSGTATVTIDDETFLVRPNESTYIQAGQLHRLENDGLLDLVMIEVQVGEYTGEDDIVRLDDVYQR